MHGWDVGQATGAPPDLPDDLALALLPVAQAVVRPEDRAGPVRALPRRTGPDAPVLAARLLLGLPGPLPDQTG